jgi:2,3-dihydroxybenzoate-AMP ligase
MISFSHWAKDHITKGPGPDRVPLTYEHLVHWAVQTPQAPAIVLSEGTLNYRALEHHVNVLTQVLAKFNLRVGQVVLLSVSNFYTTLLMLIALENLGLVSAMARKRGQLETDPLWPHASLVMSDQAIELPRSVPLQLINEAWLSTVLSQSRSDIAGIMHSPVWQDGVRLSSSSGTSQEPKPIMLNHEVQASWHQFYLDSAGYSPSSRLLVLGSLAVNVFYSRVVVCLRLGGAVMPPFELNRFEAFAPNALCALPLDIETLLNQLPASFNKPSHLVIHTGGAALSTSLRQRSLNRLCSAIHNNYGCVETGVLTQMDEEKTGTLVPGVVVQIVDDSDQPLPLGQTGLLRAKSPTMIQSYWNHEQASANAFRDGWFYPGDEAVMLSERQLKLIGRRDDLLNLGGVKVSPQPFEQALKNLDWVSDAAFVAVGATDSKVMSDRFGVALVMRDGQQPDQWMNRVLAVVQNLSVWMASNEVKPLCIVMPALPYTDTGKVKRQQIRELFKKAIADHAKAPQT